MAEVSDAEDPDNVSAQHFIECELCCKTVSLHCTICKSDLCGQCVGIHINSMATQEHNIVSYRRRAFTPQLPLCSIHESEKCDLFCSKCNVPICVTCITLQHKAHPATKLEVQCNFKKKQIEDECKHLENDLCKNIMESIAHLQKNLEEVRKIYDKAQDAVFQKGTEWHKKVDKIVQEFSQQVTDMRNRDIALLEKRIEEIKGLLKALNVHRERVNKLTTTMKLKDVLDYELRDLKCMQFYRPYLSMPSYDLSEQQMKFMSMAFGSLRSNIPQHLKVFSSDIENLRNICSRVVLCQSIETHLDTICSLAPPIKSTVWVNAEEKTINLVDSGKVIKRIEAKSGTRPINLAMTRQGFLVYAVYDHHQSNVCIVTKNKTDQVITFNYWKPVGICCTRNDEFLVSMKSKDETQIKIARFSGDFKIIQEIQYDENHQPLYASGKYYVFVEENKNMDICASDPNKNQVVVTDKDGLLRWRYNGNLEKGKFKSFSPSFIAADSHSNLLVMDTDNDCVHLLDMNGIFITFITHPKIQGIGAMSMDTNDKLWIANYKGGQINVFKYLQ
uniref:B box-type domain-containing protein n=2 Tax=Magallana gigas TaxID=29159 RepID=A0A8W8L3E6_MAGGI|nr:uncharacterized protein LOC105330444 [Crassostrea gigas]XP_019923705.2 uncharacterized protein LOC105330444 [Crassostrea gigas]XP_034302233.1 uncharacterized protein LOC105330444 [Crassostrea gigas]